MHTQETSLLFWENSQLPQAIVDSYTIQTIYNMLSFIFSRICQDDDQQIISYGSQPLGV